MRLRKPLTLNLKKAILRHIKLFRVKDKERNSKAEEKNKEVTCKEYC